MVKFYLLEAVKSFKNARLSSVFSILTLSMAVILITLALAGILSSNYLEGRVKEKVTVNLFLKKSLDHPEIENIMKNLSEKSFVSGVEYISPAKAEEMFIRETGEDFRDILEFNPLPPSISIKIKPEYVVSDSISALLPQLGRLPGVDEVVFQGGTIYKILAFLSSLKFYILIAALLISAIAFYIVYVTSRLIIQIKMLQIETMKLAGARLSSIKIPILINGIINGLAASALTGFVYLILWRLLTNYYPDNGLVFFDNMVFYAGVLISGPVIGFLGSLTASGKITLKVQKFIF